MEPVALDALLRSATTRLADAGCPSPAADAAALLAHALDCELGELHRRVLLGHALAGDDRPDGSRTAGPACAKIDGCTL